MTFVEPPNAGRQEPRATAGPKPSRHSLLVVDLVELRRHVQVITQSQHPDAAAHAGRQAAPPEVRHLTREPHLTGRGWEPREVRDTVLETDGRWFERRALGWSRFHRQCGPQRRTAGVLTRQSGIIVSRCPGSHGTRHWPSLNRPKADKLRTPEEY